MMDVESGKTSAARGGSRLPRVFAAASTFVSCLALGGVFLLVLHNQSLQTQIDGLQQATQSAVRVQDSAQKKIARREVSMEMEIQSIPAQWCCEHWIIQKSFLFHCINA